MDELTAAQHVERIGLWLFGEHWGGPIARLSRVNARTIERLRGAAQSGDDYSSARGVLAALHEIFALAERETRPFARSGGSGDAPLDAQALKTGSGSQP